MHQQFTETILSDDDEFGLDVMRKCFKQFETIAAKGDPRAFGFPQLFDRSIPGLWIYEFWGLAFACRLDDAKKEILIVDCCLLP